MLRKETRTLVKVGLSPNPPNGGPPDEQSKDLFSSTEVGKVDLSYAAWRVLERLYHEDSPVAVNKMVDDIYGPDSPDNRKDVNRAILEINQRLGQNIVNGFTPKKSRYDSSGFFYIPPEVKREVVFPLLPASLLEGECEYTIQDLEMVTESKAGYLQRQIKQIAANLGMKLKTLGGVYVFNDSEARRVIHEIREGDFDPNGNRNKAELIFNEFPRNVFRTNEEMSDLIKRKTQEVMEPAGINLATIALTIIMYQISGLRINNETEKDVYKTFKTCCNGGKIHFEAMHKMYSLESLRKLAVELLADTLEKYWDKKRTATTSVKERLIIHYSTVLKKLEYSIADVMAFVCKDFPQAIPEKYQVPTKEIRPIPRTSDPKIIFDSSKS